MGRTKFEREEKRSRKHEKEGFAKALLKLQKKRKYKGYDDSRWGK